MPQNDMKQLAASNEFSNIKVPNEVLNNRPIDPGPSNCPNLDVWLTILNILTNSIPNDNNSLLEPEKFKYVLNIVKRLLQNAQNSPENLNLYNRFNNLEKHLENIKAPSKIARMPDEVKNKVKAKISVQYELPWRHHNCQEIFNTIFSLLSVIYSQVLRYCKATGKCNSYYANNLLNNYSQHFTVYDNPFNTNAQDTIPVQTVQNKLNYYPLNYSVLKASSLPDHDLINFVKNQEGKGIHDIMTILQNYRPKSFEINDSNRVNESQLNNDPGNIFSINQTPEQHTKLVLNIPNETIHKLNKLLERNPKDFAFKTMPGQNILSALDNIGGNSYKNQQHLKVIPQNLYTGKYTANALNEEIPLYGNINNEQKVPIGNDIPIISKEYNKVNYFKFPNDPHKSLNPNSLYDIVKSLTYGQSNTLPNLHTILLPKFTEADLPYENERSLLNKNIYDNIKTYNILPIKNDWKIKSSDQSNIKTFQQFHPYDTYEPIKQLYDQNLIISKYNPITWPFVEKFSDKKQHVNHDNRLVDLNQLLGIANQVKLNSLPNNNDIVELTYMLKRPQPVVDPVFYVKYRLPYQTFLYNLENLLIKKPYLRNEPNLLYQELLVGSNVTDSSRDLKALGYDQIVRLTTTNGTLVAAKVLENNDTTIDKALKIVQNLNSNLPIENIINLNRNITDNEDLKQTKFVMNRSANRTVSNTFVSNPLFITDAERRLGVKQYLNYPNKYRLSFNPYDLYKIKPLNNRLPFLNYGNNLLKPSALNIPKFNTQNLLTTYPKVFSYGK